MRYVRFGVMILTSTVVMYGLMYLNTFEIDHVLFSQTRLWMALIMGSTMAVVMLLFMGAMYPNRVANLVILGGSVVVFGLSLFLVRSQTSVDDISFMEAMIPHHSIAIMTSGRAQIRDPRVRSLADDIYAAQVREIAEMKSLIADLRANPVPDGAPVLPKPTGQ